MNNSGKVAVCIPTFNQASYLSVAVASVFSQTRKPDEVWISDDCSTDDTQTVVDGLLREYPSIKYFRQEKNLGMGGNPNWLMRGPKTEFVAKLDSDDFYEPEYIGKLVEVLERNPKAGYAHAATWQVNDAGVRVRARCLYRNYEYISGEDSLRMLSNGYKVSSNIIVFRRDALESVDFWKSDMAFGDDFDLAVRLADAGWGNVYILEFLANYRVWSDASNYRAGRRLSEINGMRRVFEESLMPAYVRRNWSLGPLLSKRRLMAANYVNGFHKLAANSEASEAIKDALITLGDGWRLRFNFFLVKIGLGYSLEAKSRARVRVGDFIKKLIR